MFIRLATGYFTFPFVSEEAWFVCLVFWLNLSPRQTALLSVNIPCPYVILKSIPSDLFPSTNLSEVLCIFLPRYMSLFYTTLLLIGLSFRFPCTYLYDVLSTFVNSKCLSFKLPFYWAVSVYVFPVPIFMIPFLPL